MCKGIANIFNSNDIFQLEIDNSWMGKLSTISNIALLQYLNVKSISHVTVNVTKVNAFLHKNKDKDEKLLYRIALTLMDLASRRVCNLSFPPPTFTLCQTSKWPKYKSSHIFSSFRSIFNQLIKVQYVYIKLFLEVYGVVFFETDTKDETSFVNSWTSRHGETL